MKQVVPGIWSWSVHNAERGIDFNGWYVQVAGTSLVIDPPPAGEETLAEIEQLGRPEVVLLTNKHHTRASEALQSRFDCPLAVNELDAGLMDVPVDRTFADGDTLAGGVVAVTVRDGKTPGETAFVIPGETRAMIVGDAVIGKPAGSLSMLPDEKFADPVAAKAGLRPLLAHEFEALLLGDGESILEHGRDRLREFVES